MTRELNLFLDKDTHVYTDSYGNTYNSVTTLTGDYKYVSDFNAIAAACEKIGKNPNHPKYPLYKNMTKRQILKKWDKDKKKGATKGSIKHDYLETRLKKSLNYKVAPKLTQPTQIFTINHILQDHTYGTLDLDKLYRTHFKRKYPQILDFLTELHLKGYRMYPEICTYDPEILLSGLIDLLLIKDTSMIIVDWKTNKDPKIMFEAGYYEKDNNNNFTGKYIQKDYRMKPPLDHLASSTGNQHALQLSTYARLTENFGFKLSGICLWHIRELDKIETASMIRMPYLKDEVNSILHYTEDTDFRKV